MPVAESTEVVRPPSAVGHVASNVEGRPKQSAQQEPRIVHVVTGLHPDSGGPSRTVVNLTDALSLAGNSSVKLVTQRLRGEPIVPAGGGRVERRVGETASRFALMLGLGARREVENLWNSEGIDLLHSHGLWLPLNGYVSRFAEARRIPIVIQPRGMLEPWALAHRKFKKQVAMHCYQRRHLQAAKVLVATSEMELESIRRIGVSSPVAVVPNGVFFKADATSLGSRLPLPHRRRTVLFLSRIHPKKGLLNLVRAWSTLPTSGWRLLIAGPDESGHLQEVLALVQDLGLSESVEHVASVDGEAKDNLYRSSDVFVLPTFSENFGVVVAEALSHGLPVITTRAAPWSDLISYRCGWWIDVGAEPLADALRTAMGLDDEERSAMGARGRDYVRRYDWTEIAQSMDAVYQWALGRGSRPQCVVQD